AASNVLFSSTLRAARPSGQTVTSWPRRGSSERMNSCSDFSSSTNSTRRLLCVSTRSLPVVRAVMVPSIPHLPLSCSFSPPLTPTPRPRPQGRGVGVRETDLPGVRLAAQQAVRAGLAVGNELLTDRRTGRHHQPAHARGDRLRRWPLSDGPVEGVLQ